MRGRFDTGPLAAGFNVKNRNQANVAMTLANIPAVRTLEIIDARKLCCDLDASS